MSQILASTAQKKYRVSAHADVLKYFETTVTVTELHSSLIQPHKFFWHTELHIANSNASAGTFLKKKKKKVFPSQINTIS